MTNAAVESLPRIFASADPDGPHVVTEDFVLDDRSTNVANMGRLVGPGEWRNFVATAYEVGEPEFSIAEVVAVRCERGAAVRVLVDYGDGYVSQDGVDCVMFDPTISLIHRWTRVDTAAIAVAELERLCRADEDQPPTR